MAWTSRGSVSGSVALEREQEQQTPASLLLALGAALIIFKLAIILTDDIKMGLSNNKPFLILHLIVTRTHFHPTTIFPLLNRRCELCMESGVRHRGHGRNAANSDDTAACPYFVLVLLSV